ncbi:hypothetical protein M3Y94_00183600 [Aphelenchoides besseyi]|nr:hypothetical protein M3Y94_00183600 [Aphelenchoides besseyi]KAI6236860.1 Poly(A) RNA polymerase gld-2-like protein A [Aphelenchoides besseyi]
MKRALPVVARSRHKQHKVSTDSTKLVAVQPSIIDIKKKYANEIVQLNKQIVDFEHAKSYKYSKIVEERLPVIRLIEKAICRPNLSRLITVGSLATNLASENRSDIDLCFLTDEPGFIHDFFNNYDFRITFMNSIIDQIGALKDLNPGLELKQDVFPLYFTRVPLLMSSFKNKLAMDLQFVDPRYHAIRNTNMCRTYAAADARFRQVYFWLRSLLYCLGIKNSKEGLLSSYHIMLLVIHFLQYKTKPPVLPVLSLTHPNLVGLKLTLEELLERIEMPFDKIIDWKSENQLAVGELVVDLITYYASFDPFTQAIDIGKGRVEKKKRITNDHQLELYDPYSPKTVASSRELPNAIKWTFQYIHRQMQRGELINSFPYFPESRRFRYSMKHLEITGRGFYK